MSLLAPLKLILDHVKRDLSGSSKPVAVFSLYDILQASSEKWKPIQLVSLWASSIACLGLIKLLAHHAFENHPAKNHLEGHFHSSCCYWWWYLCCCCCCEMKTLDERRQTGIPNTSMLSLTNSHPKPLKRQSDKPIMPAQAQDWSFN